LPSSATLSVALSASLFLAICAMTISPSSGQDRLVAGSEGWCCPQYAS
jgi:hypothetical protein